MTLPQPALVIDIREQASPAAADLPADPADCRPTIVIDTREQAPLPFRRLAFTRGTLYSGDYSTAGLEDLFAVERKSVADLVGCCTGQARARFERELLRLRGCRFARLLIVGSRAEIEQHRYRSTVSPQAVLATLAAFEARYVPVAWAPDPEAGGRLVEAWACWFAREIAQAARPLLRSPAPSLPANAP